MQAAKYGLKGSRLNDAKAALDWFDSQLAKHSGDGFSGENTKMCDCDLSTFPTGEHIGYIPEDTTNRTVAMYEVCNRKLTVTSKLGYNRDIVQKFHDAYGARAKMAAENVGVDFKAVSHAFRAAYQMKQLFTEGTITFPLKEAKFLTEIKTAQIPYLTLAPQLEELIDEIKSLAANSDFMEKPDREFWDNWLVWRVSEEIKKWKR